MSIYVYWIVSQKIVTSAVGVHRHYRTLLFGIGIPVTCATLMKTHELMDTSTVYSHAYVLSHTPLTELWPITKLKSACFFKTGGHFCVWEAAGGALQ